MWKWLVYDLRAEQPAVEIPTGRRWFVWQIAGGLTLVLALGFGLGFGYGSRSAPAALAPPPIEGPIPLSVRLPADVEAPVGGLEISAFVDPAEAAPNGKS
jgi:hypothetical protein